MELDVMDEWDFPRFEFKLGFGQMSYIACISDRYPILHKAPGKHLFIFIISNLPPLKIKASYPDHASSANPVISWQEPA